MAMKTYRTAAQQDLYVNAGFFSTRLHCTGCGKKWAARGKKVDDEVNGHAASCRRAPNPLVDPKAVIAAAFGRL